ncbi:hypothetical protein C8J56DRAFT_1101842 [Mycena floridula]|nr:hypothetical protein C8J56DRAFT_1101842 [Mycena floridula]
MSVPGQMRLAAVVGMPNSAEYDFQLQQVLDQLNTIIKPIVAPAPPTTAKSGPVSVETQQFIRRMFNLWFPKVIPPPSDPSMKDLMPRAANGLDIMYWESFGFSGRYCLESLASVIVPLLPLVFRWILFGWQNPQLCIRFAHRDCRTRGTGLIAWFSTSPTLQKAMLVIPGLVEELSKLWSTQYKSPISSSSCIASPMHLSLIRDAAGFALRRLLSTDSDPIFSEAKDHQRRFIRAVGGVKRVMETYMEHVSAIIKQERFAPDIVDPDQVQRIETTALPNGDPAQLKLLILFLDWVDPEDDFDEAGLVKTVISYGKSLFTWANKSRSNIITKEHVVSLFLGLAILHLEKDCTTKELLCGIFHRFATHLVYVQAITPAVEGIAQVEEKYAAQLKVMSSSSSVVMPLWLHFVALAKESSQLKMEWKSQRVIDCGETSCDFVSGSATTMKACSACQTIFYCSKECQKRHWKTHKPSCLRSRRYLQDKVNCFFPERNEGLFLRFLTVMDIQANYHTVQTLIYDLIAAADSSPSEDACVILNVDYTVIPVEYSVIWGRFPFEVLSTKIKTAKEWLKDPPVDSAGNLKPVDIFKRVFTCRGVSHGYSSYAYTFKPLPADEKNCSCGCGELANEKRSTFVQQPFSKKSRFKIGTQAREWE